LFESWSNLPLTSGIFWAGIIWMGVAVTTLPFLFQNFGQRFQSSSRVAVIFTLEPVFATIFGAIFGNEGLPLQLIVGGGLILLANLIATQSSTVKGDPVSRPEVLASQE
jgi:drug/metabolite transporter (DMT)-like permease